MRREEQIGSDAPAPNQYHPDYAQVKSSSPQYTLTAAQRVMYADPKNPGPGDYTPNYEPVQNAVP